MPRPPDHLRKLGGEQRWTQPQNFDVWSELVAMRKQLESILTGQATLHAEMTKISRQHTEACGGVVKKAGEPVLTKVPTLIEDGVNDFEQSRALSRADSRPSVQTTLTSIGTARGSTTHAVLLSQVNERRRRHLLRTIEVNEQLESRASAKKERAREMRQMGWRKRIQTSSARELETYIDSVMSTVISSNAVFIGLRVDHGEGADAVSWWTMIDAWFTIFFAAELSCKVWIHGLKGHFVGKRCHISNCFDAVLIMLDCLQLAISLCMTRLEKDLNDKGVPSASLFRIVRLARLTRLIRLLRTDKFNDLLAMLRGLADGALTLVWAVIVFLLMVYTVALVCRECFGNQNVFGVSDYFRNVPIAMFTVFRCSFGDCTSKEGYPIPEYISSGYGGGYMLVYCMFIFFIYVGLFNVISAIFVDTTMSAAADLHNKKFQDRLVDEERWAESVAVLLRELLAATPDHNLSNVNWLENIEDLAEVEFTPSTLDAAIHNQHIQVALSNLDIDMHDYHKLSDILDPDQSGGIGVLELISGLDRLRGMPRRSDVISVDLMVRNLQEMVDEVLQRLVVQQQQFIELDAPVRTISK